MTVFVLRMFLRFLHSLHQHGRAELSSDGMNVAAIINTITDQPQELAKATHLLKSWHTDAAMDFPGSSLAFHPIAALWGARLLFRATCLIAYRDLNEDDIVRWLKLDLMPDPSDPAAHYSADICLRHWASLYRMARARSEDDPLVKVMAELTSVAPLTAPGMHIAVDTENSFFLHTGLSQIFAERALERSDSICLSLPMIQHLVRSKLGAYATELGRGLLPTPIASS